MFCPECGHSLPDNSRFCTGCGKQLQVNEPGREDPEAQIRKENENIESNVYNGSIYQNTTPEGQSSQDNPYQCTEGQSGQTYEYQWQEGQPGQTYGYQWPEGQSEQTYEYQWQEGQPGQVYEYQLPAGQSGQVYEYQLPEGQPGQVYEYQLPEGQSGQVYEYQLPAGQSAQEYEYQYSQRQFQNGNAEFEEQYSEESENSNNYRRINPLRVIGIVISTLFFGAATAGVLFWLVSAWADWDGVITEKAVIILFLMLLLVFFLLLLLLTSGYRHYLLQACFAGISLAGMICLFLSSGISLPVKGWETMPALAGNAAFAAGILAVMVGMLMLSLTDSIMVLLENRRRRMSL